MFQVHLCEAEGVPDFNGGSSFHKKQLVIVKSLWRGCGDAKRWDKHHKSTAKYQLIYIEQSLSHLIPRCIKVMTISTPHPCALHKRFNNSSRKLTYYNTHLILQITSAILPFTLAYIKPIRDKLFNLNHLRYICRLVECSPHV